jgi:putative ATP-dependent endonuclease of OLD family
VPFGATAVCLQIGVANPHYRRLGRGTGLRFGERATCARHRGLEVIIQSVKIENFRSISDQIISFDQVTSFIGPNGAGKSTILRALEWFFNGPKDSLSHFDILGGQESNPLVVRVTVTFSGITAGDRIVLTDRYAPAGTDVFSARREWGLSTPDKLTGSTSAYAPFAGLRALIDGPAGPLSAAYQALSASLAETGVELPAATTKPKIVDAIATWESGRPELLTTQFVADTHMFGFAGQGEIARIFKYVFVDADLRASDESEDSSKTVISKVLGHALNRTGADAALRLLAEDVTTKHNQINTEHLGPELDKISEKLSAGVMQYTTGRTVKLSPRGSEYVPPKSRVDVSVWDHGVQTKMASQGHGFQRALLISSLQILAEYAGTNDHESTLFLAIEEPELFQHPNQARAFASVLRGIAESDVSSQVAYATHSPYFVDPVRFEEVRRVTKSSGGAVVVTSTTRERVATAVAGQQAQQWDINSTWSNVILKDLREALFASAVVLCEGPDDAAVLLGASRHTRDFNLHGISVASAGGKTDLFLAHAVLHEFGIPVLTVFDNDSDMRTRSIERKKRKNGNALDLSETELAAIDASVKSDAVNVNLKICDYFGVSRSEYPVGELSANLYSVTDTLESVLQSDWPEMLAQMEEVIRLGQGSKKSKHVATYQLAAETCSTAPRGQLAEIIELALKLTS